MEVGGHYVEGGVDGYSAWANMMRNDFPHLQDPTLKDIWSAIKPEAQKRVTTPRTNRERTIQTLVQELGQEEAKAVVKKLSEIDDADPNALFKFNQILREASKFGLSDKLSWYQRANLMSGIPGTIRDVVSTGAWQGVDNLIFRPTRGAIEQGLAKLQNRTPELYAGETLPAVKGLIRGVNDGAKEFLNVMKHGYDSTAARKLDLPTHYEGPGGAKNPFNAVLRFRAALNQFQRAMGEGAETAAIAYRRVKQEGLEGEAARTRFNELVNNPDAEMLTQIGDYGDYSTFTDKSDALLRAFYGLRSLQIPGTKVKPLEFHWPFVKTTYNIMKRGLELTPAGAAKVLSKEVRSNPAQMADILAKQLTGASLITGLTAYALSGDNFTTYAPDDPHGKQDFYNSGKQEWSVRVGNKWVPFKDFGPFSVPLAVVAAFTHKYKQSGEAPPERDVDKAVTELSGRVFIDQTALRSTFDVYESITDPYKGGLNEVVGEQARGFVPFSTSVRNLAESQDYYLRDPQIWYQWVMDGLPGLRPKVPLHKHPIENKKQGVKVLSPIQITDRRWR